MKSNRKSSIQISIDLDVEDFDKLNQFAIKQKSDISALIQVIIHSSCKELERCGEFD